ncbi:hypothetical protein V5O48_009384 [Marasmius crinis-equi]|uniref:Uncharacterized protein n=1 Tax=Marasmius crinis-equi TaxID=585013 RepID=A0ABR3FBZ3_9AGAR
MQAPESPTENPNAALEYPDSDNASILSAPSPPPQPVDPRPPSPPTVYLHPPPRPDAQERQDRRNAWVTKPNYGGWGDDKMRYLW